MSAEIPHPYGIDPAALEAMRNGEAPPAPQPEAPTPEAAEPAAEEAAETPEQEAAEQVEAPKKGNPDVPLRQLRQQIQQYESMLSDPSKLAGFLRANGYDMTPLGATPAAASATASTTPAPDAADPFAAFDPETATALRSAVEAKLAPVNAQLARVEAERSAAQHHANLLALDQQHPGLIDNTKAFDAVAPDHATLDPLMKHLAWQGNRMTDPTQHGDIVRELLAKMDPAQAQALLEPLAKGHAVQMVADKLAGTPQGSSKPVTLSGALPARDNGSLKDINSMTTAEWAALPAHVKDQYLG
jgi:hypothetical protein